VKSRPAAAARPIPETLTLRHPASRLLLGVLAIAIACLVTHRLADPDLWQHLRVGRTIWERHAVPLTHEWTWPRFGEREVLPSWLFRALLWPFYAIGGVWGLQTWRWLTTLGALALLALAARRLGARGMLAWLALVLCALVYRQRSQVRPETLVAVLMALELYLLERVRAGEKRAAWALPAVALVWANAHVSYWIGIALTVIFAVEAWWRERKPPRELLGALAGSAALSFANPFGGAALWQPFEYQLHLKQDPLFRTIAELKPVDWSENRWNGLPLLVAGWPLLAALRSRRGRGDLVEWGLIALFLPLGLGTQRFVGFLSLAATPYLARDVAELCAGRRALALWPRAVAVSIAGLAMVALELSHTGLALGPGIDTRFTPVAACDYIERAGVRGRGLNEFWQGGYLLWRFWPERDRLPFIDIHQSASAGDRALVARLGDDPLAFTALDRERHFEWVLTTNTRTLSGALPDELDADSSWRLVFYDDAALLYVRRDGALGGIAARDGYRLLAGGDGALARLGLRVATDSTARRALTGELERAVATSPERAGLAHRLLANVAVVEGRWPDAVRELDAAIASGVEVPGLRERRAQAAAMASGSGTR
jgi:hypothetical protein